MHNDRLRQEEFEFEITLDCLHSKKLSQKMVDQGVGEMAQWLRVFVVFAEGLGLVPSTVCWLTTTLNSSSRGSDALSDL